MGTSLAIPRIVAVDNEALPTHWGEFFVKNKAKLHVVLLYENEAENGKLWPASEIIAGALRDGKCGNTDTVIDSTSGNYGVALAVVLRQQNARNPNFPFKRVVAVVSKSLPMGKRERLLKYGIELIDAEGQIDAMQVAERVANEQGYFYTRQYWNELNSFGYRSVAESIADRLPMLGMAAWGVGSGGGCSGVMPVLHDRFKDRGFSFQRVAVVVEDRQKVGGVRDEAALEPGSLGWRAPNIDDVRFVGEEASYRFSAALWRSGCFVGPSTGFAGEGACLAARRLVIMRTFDEIRAPDGFVHILIPSLDKRTPYRSEYEQRGIYFSGLFLKV